jgi:hypothetical protein
MSETGTPGVTAIDEVRMARLHLRLGQLTLARSELEDLARADTLAPAGLAALAEALWRTGDPDAAADAAQAHLEAGGNEDVAVAIAAEAAAAEGRPGEARQLMDRLGPPDAASLDALFAGMPRRAFWPTAPGEHLEIGTLFGEPDRAPGAGPGTGMPQAPHPQPAPGPTAGPPARSVPGPLEVMEATDPGLWGPLAEPGAEEATPRSVAKPGPAAERRPRGHLDPIAELAKAREELDSLPERAMLRMALVLRLDPTFAPAVLDAISLRREPEAAMLRGDAQRLLGRHLEAEAAFDAVADSLEAS